MLISGAKLRQEAEDLAAAGGGTLWLGNGIITLDETIDLAKWPWNRVLIRGWQPARRGPLNAHSLSTDQPVRLRSA